MQISEILQYKEYKKLCKQGKNKGPHKSKINITETDIRECMGYGAWKRGRGGAIRQIRW